MRGQVLIAPVVVLGVVLLVRAEVAAPTRIAGDSMSPTLTQNEVAIVAKVGVAPARGDLVVFASPVDGHDTIKRVIGIGGDDVAIRDALLFVNDKRADGPQVNQEAIDGTYFGPVTVPSGQVLVLGDNRANSIDSRNYGTLDLDAITGEVHFMLWPPGPVD